jgi:hypothetical protein
MLILIELGLLFFPANMIGCSEPPDPFDEYITFFRNDVAPAKYDGFISKFKHNKYFPQLIEEYGNTAFYREAFNTCSYLRDFVKGK